MFRSETLDRLADEGRRETDPARREVIYRGVEECLAEAYRHGPSVHAPSAGVPDDPEIPLLLDRVYPCHEVVKVDWHVPGCPPPAEALWQALTALLEGRAPVLPWHLVKYD